MKKILSIVAFVYIFGLSLNSVSAALVPTLTLTNNSSTVGIGITGADPNSVVNFYFPNTSVTNNSSTNISYTSIGIGQTDSSGSFSISVAPNSYGLSGGVAVYVSVNGANSPKIVWPASTVASGQTSGSLSLSQNNITVTTGLTASVLALNTSNKLTVQSNSNPNVASAFVQQSNNSVLISAMNTGSTVISICATDYGCSSTTVSVVAPTQTITFSLPQVYLAMGNSPQVINIYGPSSGYTVSNTNRDSLSTSLDGSKLSLQGLSTGQATLTVCAPGWNCGTLSVNILAAGSAIPYQTSTPQPMSSDLTQTPDITSFSLDSNNVYNKFLGKSSNITLTFGVTQTVQNVKVKIADTTVPATQGTDGKYYAQYRITGNESSTIPVSVSFTNLGGIPNQYYFTISNTIPTNTSTTATSNQSSVCPTGLTCTPISGTSGSYTFTRYLYEGMTASNSSDADVYALQKHLTAVGVYSGPITGYFGPLTKAAVKAYQKKHGLVQVGVVGPGTRALLNKGE
jgi:hypothetical protein